MHTFAVWRTILTNDLQALKELERPAQECRWRYTWKEQELGQHCCQAGEDLTDAELALLKQLLGLTEPQWGAYLSKIRLPPD